MCDYTHLKRYTNRHEVIKLLLLAGQEVALAAPHAPLPPANGPAQPPLPPPQPAELVAVAAPDAPPPRAATPPLLVRTLGHRKPEYPPAVLVTAQAWGCGRAGFAVQAPLTQRAPAPAAQVLFHTRAGFNPVIQP